MKILNKINLSLVFFYYTIILILSACNNNKPDNNSNNSQSDTMNMAMTSLKLNKEQLQLANIKVDSIKLKIISEEITLTGKLVLDENKTRTISSRIQGRIDKLYFKNPGDIIKPGDVIYEIYSEELQSVQKEYLLSIKQQKLAGNNSDYISIVKSIENKMLLWGLTPQQIERLKQSSLVMTTVPIYSKINASVNEINIKEGDYVMEGSPLFKLSDNFSLWVEAQAYTGEVQNISEQKPVDVIIDAFPNQKIKSIISFINPETESNSKINLIRVELKNADNKYKPGMLATVILKTKEKKAITLPVDAVIRDSKGSSVWIQNSDNSFEVRMVETGIQNSDEIEIISGLEEGEKVVISGSYLLNSEYILKNGADPMSDMKM